GASQRPAADGRRMALQRWHHAVFRELVRAGAHGHHDLWGDYPAWRAGVPGRVGVSVDCGDLTRPTPDEPRRGHARTKARPRRTPERPDLKVDPTTGTRGRGPWQAGLPAWVESAGIRS